MSALWKCSCQVWEPDCAFLRACCWGPAPMAPPQRGQTPTVERGCSPIMALQVSCHPGRARESEPVKPLHPCRVALAHPVAGGVVQQWGTRVGKGGSTGCCHAAVQGGSLAPCTACMSCQGGPTGRVLGRGMHRQHCKSSGRG